VDSPKKQSCLRRWVNQKRISVQRQIKVKLEVQVSITICCFQKGLIEIPEYSIAETGLDDANQGVRDCPSLVGGRPAKSVVERPRGFKSHIPRHFQIQPAYEPLFNN
jgi:hypothetical protein